MAHVPHPSACPLDCPDTCSLAITVEATTGALVGLEGDARNPLTDGAICGKVRRFGERFDGPARLDRPWIRKPGREGQKGRGSFPADFEPASWDAALARIAERLAAVRDKSAILPVSYGGSNGKLTEGLVDERLWRRLGAARLLRTLCAAPGGAAAAGLYGKMPGAALSDHVHAELILVWGHNPRVSGMHYVSILAEAEKRGAKLVVIDPRRTALAKRATLHLAPRPGTDLVLALGMLRELFARGYADHDFLAAHTRGHEALRAAAEPWDLDRVTAETGLARADIESLVELYHTASPAVIRLGWGVERNRSGASACAAILALPAVAGKFGPRGGGFTASMSRGIEFDLEPSIAAPETQTRAVNLSRLGAALLDDGSSGTGPRTEVAFVYDNNPVATVPDQNAVAFGFARADLFTVVFEQSATDTVDYADVVLPATTFLEHEELRVAYGANFVAHSQATLAPRGEARCNAAVFAELIRRLGLELPGDLTDPAELAAKILADSALSPAQRQSLAATGGAPTAFELEHGHAAIPFVDFFPRTPDQRIDLAPADMPGLYAYAPVPTTPAFPLALISPAHLRLTSSTFGETLDGEIPLVMHPDDMAARGLVDGARVRIFNERGEVLTHVTLDREPPRPGTVILPKGLWRRHTANGQTATALAPEHLSDFGDGACYNDARVEVEGLIAAQPHA